MFKKKQNPLFIVMRWDFVIFNALCFEIYFLLCCLIIVGVSILSRSGVLKQLELKAVVRIVVNVYVLYFISWVSDSGNQSQSNQLFLLRLCCILSCPNILFVYIICICK